MANLNSKIKAILKNFNRQQLYYLIIELVSIVLELHGFEETNEAVIGQIKNICSTSQHLCDLIEDDI
jgi:hypothetical protein